MKLAWPASDEMPKAVEVSLGKIVADFERRQCEARSARLRWRAWCALLAFSIFTVLSGTTSDFGIAAMILAGASLFSGAVAILRLWRG
jgi:hypothetical protein